jgi:purine/pyrimidine-nucleoside phosphorylase
MSASPITSFENVTAITKANIYFDGKVISHTLQFADGSKKTLGVIQPGEYHFGTQAPERMDMVAGDCKVRLDGQAEWTAFAGGSGFDVPGNSGFSITVSAGFAEYICSFK